MDLSSDLLKVQNLLLSSMKQVDSSVLRVRQPSRQSVVRLVLVKRTSWYRVGHSMRSSSIRLIESSPLTMKRSTEEHLPGNLSSVVNVESIDYGFITDTITVAEDYGDVSYDEIYYPWQKEDFGTLLLPQQDFFGLGRLHSSTETPRVRNFIGNQEHAHLRVLGTGKVYVLPKFTSKGDLVKLRGDTTFSRARDWVGTGNLPTVSGTAEAVAFVPAKDDRALFNFEGELVEKFGKGNYDGVGQLFGFDSSAVSIIIGVTVSGLFSVHGEVVDKAIFSEVGSGSLGHFDGGAESYIRLQSANLPSEYVKVKIMDLLLNLHSTSAHQLLLEFMLMMLLAHMQMRKHLHSEQSSMQLIMDM